MSGRPRLTFIVAMLETAIPQLVPRGAYGPPIEPNQHAKWVPPAGSGGTEQSRRGRHRRGQRG